MVNRTIHRPSPAVPKLRTAFRSCPVCVWPVPSSKVGLKLIVDLPDRLIRFFRQPGPQTSRDAESLPRCGSAVGRRANPSSRHAACGALSLECEKRGIRAHRRGNKGHVDSENGLSCAESDEDPERLAPAADFFNGATQREIGRLPRRNKREPPIGQLLRQAFLKIRHDSCGVFQLFGLIFFVHWRRSVVLDDNGDSSRRETVNFSGALLDILYSGAGARRERQNDSREQEPR